MKADLHVHTTFSDGVWTPLEVAQAAAAQGMDVLAITDHDALGGADALRGQSLALQVIPGLDTGRTRGQLPYGTSWTSCPRPGWSARRRCAGC